jgi:hypothetical protein
MLFGNRQGVIELAFVIVPFVAFLTVQFQVCRLENGRALC